VAGQGLVAVTIPSECDKKGDRKRRSGGNRLGSRDAGADGRLREPQKPQGERKNRTAPGRGGATGRAVRQAGSFVETNRKKLGGQKMGWRHKTTRKQARPLGEGCAVRDETDERGVNGAIGDRRGAWPEKACR
jgi:hypothetical protein